jgi:hypothetical protein
MVRPWLLRCSLALAEPVQDGGDDDPGDTSNVPLRDCKTMFVSPDRGVTMASRRRPGLTVEAADARRGWLHARQGASAGIRATGRRDEQWILDPANQYRAYDGGTENSGMRVGDCKAPLVKIVSHETSADGAVTKLALFRGADGAKIETLRAVRRFEGVETPLEIERTDGDLAIWLTALPAGKHTVVVDAVAEDAATRTACSFRSGSRRTFTIGATR